MDTMFWSALFLVTILNLYAGRGSAEKAEALFVFGDSYADTGNHDPYDQTVNQVWRKPNGLDWPGYPAGRVSSGKIQTDFWGDILGLPCPVSYELLKNHDCEADAERITQGVNFAVGGSGIFRAYGFTTIPEQVKQFKKLIAASSGFDSHKLSRSVALISAAGNDYVALRDSTNGSVEGLVDLVEPVVSGTMEAVKDLYESGLRNFVVSNVAPFGCAPQIGKTSCDSKYDDTINLHTKLLTEGVHHLRSNLEGSSIIISDLVAAFYHIFSHSTQYGFEDIFMPCCDVKGGVNMCTEVDERGRALFEVCDNVDNKFFWDFGHPTHRGWYEVMSLYAYGAHEGNRKLNFIEGASNAIEWVQSLGFLAHDISLQSATAVL
uniref:Putative ester hydrolase n=1 Tax=Taxus baccata TaxID=25629 RepID=A0A0F7J3M5_TAXBA|nr:putative ester hydrolase [Taxus baccata]